MSLRFRALARRGHEAFVAAFKRGVPIVALRTSTHAFNFPANSPWAKYSWNARPAWPGGFGKHVLGETWLTHWGRHKIEATRGVIESAAASDPLLRGVTDLFGDSDVYEAYPPADAKILLRGLVLKGMNPPTPPPTTRQKTVATDKQPVNSPAMPIAWTRLHRNDAGTTNRILTTTLGAATDLENESLRRLVVNGVFWGLGLDHPRQGRRPLRRSRTRPACTASTAYRTSLTPPTTPSAKTLPEGGTLPPPAPKKQAATKSATPASKAAAAVSR
jgi:hypothetical protein